MSTAHGRLRALAAALPDAPALHDGGSWCSRADLLDRVAAAPVPQGRSVHVTEAQPAAALVSLLAAEAAGVVPLVTDPAWPACADRLRSTAERRPRPGREPLVAVLTSGSSGSPRTVIRTGASWAASLRSFDQVTGIGAGDVVWAPGTLSSTLTLFAAWHALCTGRPLALGRRVLPRAAHLDGVTVVHAVPAVVREVLQAKAEGALPALRTAVVAGSHVPLAVRELAQRTGVRLVEYYGAAELSFVAAGPARPAGSALRPFPGCRVEVRGPRGDALPVCAEGEIWVSSPYLSQGYLPHPDGAHTEGPFRRSGEWATVGDRGRLRPDGTLEVLGRGDAAVDVGGTTVPVDDVEAVLADVPGVLEIACVGQPHPRLGHWLVAAVRPAPGQDPLPALREAARAALPKAARPTRWVLLDEFPRTPGGKIARHSLRELLAPAPD